MNFDQLKKINNWYKSKEIKESVDILCFNRNNIDVMPEIYENYIIDKSFKVNISSTKIREAISQKEGNTITKYLHNDVFNYIRKNNLYVI